ncbi:6741_t:CDS:1, partial [Dentiscutata heterogama]
SAPMPNVVSAPMPNISSAPMPNLSGQYNYDDYYNNQMSQRPTMAYGQTYFPGEDNEISQNNMYSPQDQMNYRRYDNYGDV